MLLLRGEFRDPNSDYQKCLANCIKEMEIGFRGTTRITLSVLPDYRNDILRELILKYPQFRIVPRLEHGICVTGGVEVYFDALVHEVKSGYRILRPPKEHIPSLCQMLGKEFPDRKFRIVDSKEIYINKGYENSFIEHGLLILVGDVEVQNLNEFVCTHGSRPRGSSDFPFNRDLILSIEEVTINNK